MNEDAPIHRHRTACDGFGAVVGSVGDGWDDPSPCPDWDARGVLEHVIGFHEVLLLRPLDLRAHRPKHDVPGRWAATQSAIFTALGAHRTNPIMLRDGSTLDVVTLLPMLTTDVLVHTWDLAMATGHEPRLDPDLCAWALSGAQEHQAGLRSSGMFGPAIAVASDADPPTRLVAFLGRDPSWRPAP